ncbi:uncharacterized protein [Engystomops pustulosus]|uniref:uncharacterized protein n=1 Tax=Engystomops pustulosus TaxID=76066 RepID=UPI003AFA0B7F
MGQFSCEKRLFSGANQLSSRQVLHQPIWRSDCSSSSSRIHTKGCFGTCPLSPERFRRVFQSISCPKARRILEAGDRSYLPQPVYSEEEIQDGINQDNHTLNLQELLHDDSGSERCVSAYSSTSESQEVSPGRYTTGQNSTALPVHVSTLRSEFSTQSFYEGRRGVIGSPQVTRHPGDTLSRRLASDSSNGALDVPRSSSSPEDSGGSWVCGQQKEVVSGSCNLSEISRFYNKLFQHDALFVISQNYRSEESDQASDSAPQDNNQESHGSPRSNNLGYRSSPVGKNPYEGSPSVHSLPVVKESAVLGQTNDDLSPSYQGLNLVVPKPTIRQIHPIPSASDPYVRRIQLGLGRPSGRPVGSKEVDTVRVQIAFEPQRNERCTSGTSSLLQSPTRARSFGPIRQPGSCLLYQQAGGHEEPVPCQRVFPPDDLGRADGSQHLSDSYQGSFECAGGLAEPQSSQTFGVVSEQTSVPTNCPENWSSSDRPDGVEIKLSASPVLLPVQAGEPSSGGYTLIRLDRPISLHIPTVPSHSESVTEDQERENDNYSRDSVLAEKGLVPSSPVIVRRGILVSPSPEGLATPERVPSPQPSTSPSGGLEAERGNLRRSGFSDEVIDTLAASRKPKTLKVYQRVWGIYKQWCLSRRASSTHVPSLLQFLQDGLKKGLKFNTLKVHFTAINSSLGGIFSENLLVRRFFRGLKKLKPTVMSPLPSWDLSIVLKHLCQEPFEPISDIPLHLLSWKTVFLVAICSARRISEIQAFSCKEPYLRVMEDCIILRTMPGFLPKIPSQSALNQEIFLPVLGTDAPEEEQGKLQALDVKRSVLAYLQRAEAFRESEALFLQFRGPNKGKRASKSTLARWIKDSISMCYDLEGLPSPLNLKAHSTRSTAASWAEISHISLEQICKAAVWSGPSTFVRHYRLNVGPGVGSAFGKSVICSAASK